LTISAKLLPVGISIIASDLPVYLSDTYFTKSSVRT
jgi:hypothetical protein